MSVKLAFEEEFDISELIEGLYAAALEPELWGAWLDQLTQLCDGRPTLMLTLLSRAASEGDLPFDTPLSAKGSGGYWAAPPTQNGLFGLEGQALIEKLLPHVKQAARVNKLLQYHSRTTRQLLEAFPVGVVLLSSDADVLVYNRQAERYFEDQDGLTFREGNLYGQTPSETSKLHEAIAAVQTGYQNPCSIKLSRAYGFWPLRCIVLPLHNAQATHTDSAAVALFVSVDEESFALNELLLQSLYNLTPTEARVSALLARGLAPKEIAVKLRVQTNTVRAHLKSIYRKMNIASQVDLVRLLLTSPALYAR